MEETTGASLTSTTSATSKTQTVRKCIEENWSCRFRDSLPPELKPRRKLRDGKKRVGRDQPDQKRIYSEEWTAIFIHALMKLSKATPRDKEFAHTQLAKQVKRRQHRGTHAEHYAREVLPSDIEEVIKEVSRLTTIGRYKRKTHNELDSGKLDAEQIRKGLSDGIPSESMELRVQSEKLSRAENAMMMYEGATEYWTAMEG